MACCDARSVRRLAWALCGAATVLYACAPRSARTAAAVAEAAGAAAVTHGVMESASPNAVTALTSILYNCIAQEAARSVGRTEPPVEVPPHVDRIVAGPSRLAGTSAVADGAPLESAPPGRIVTLVGRNFSAAREHNLVKVLGLPAPVSALSGPGALTTILPFPPRRERLTTEVQAIVRGVPSRAVPLTLEPEVRSPEAPFILAKRVLAKQYAFAERVAAADFDAARGSSRAAETLRDRGTTGARLRLCAQDLSRELRSFETMLNSQARFLEVHEAVLHSSPEVERLFDRALELLPPAPAAPAGR